MKQVLIPVANEADRQTMAGILVKNMIPVRPVRAKLKKKDGTIGNTVGYFLQVELEEAQPGGSAND